MFFLGDYVRYFVFVLLSSSREVVARAPVYHEEVSIAPPTDYDECAHSKC